MVQPPAVLRFEGEVAIVTGAGAGLGRSHALELAARGASLVLNDLNHATLDAVVSDVVGGGGTAIAVAGSVDDPAVGQRLTATAVDAFGTVDIVINNAGVVRHGYFEDLTAEQINHVLDVDLRSAFWVTQPAWRVMKSKGYGRVILTGSGSGMFSHQGTANYAAAKAGLYGLMRALAFEGRDHGIGVNLLLPMAHTHMADNDPIPDYDRYRDGLVPPGTKGSLLIAPEDNTPVLIYLAHRRCSLTGEAFDVCFGRYARLFVGVGHGWIPDERITAEAFEDHLASVRDLATYSVPTSFYDELGAVGRRLGPDEPPAP